MNPQGFLPLLIGTTGGLIWAVGYHWVLRKIIPIGINRYLFIKAYELLTIGALLEVLFLFYNLATPVLPQSIGNRVVELSTVVMGFLGLHLILPYFTLLSRSKLSIPSAKLPRPYEYIIYLLLSALISNGVVKSFRIQKWCSQTQLIYLYSLAFLWLVMFGLRRIWISRVVYQLDIVEEEAVVGELVEIYGEWVEMYDEPEKVEQVEQAVEEQVVNPVLVFVII